jgi:hypothetical protein
LLLIQVFWADNFDFDQALKGLGCECLSRRVRRSAISENCG